MVRPRHDERTSLLQSDRYRFCEIQSSQNGKDRALPHDINKQAVFAQVAVAGGIFLLGITAGFPAGYSAILLPQLQESNSSVITDDNMASWIASIHSAATPVGAFISGMLSDLLGRKLALQLSVIPYIFGWTMLSLATNHTVLLVGRIMCGLSVGLGAVPAHIMLAEVLEPRIRSLLAGIPYMSYSFGILLVYTLGALFDWRMTAALGNVIPVLTVLVFFFLPESPVWLVRNRKFEKAEKALMWLRGEDTIKVYNEMELLKSRAIRNTFQNGTTQTNYLHNGTSKINKENVVGNGTPSKSFKAKTVENSKARVLCSWTILKKSELFKPFFIVSVFNFVQVLCGTYVIIFYAVTLISDEDQTKDNQEGEINPFLIAVLTAAVRFIFVCVAVVTLFWVGRRKLAIFSGLGTTFTAVALGLFFYLSERDYNFNINKSWLITGLILAYVAANTVGFFILPGIAIGELLPVSIRGTAGGFIMGTFNILLFFVVKIFPFLLSYLKRDGIFWFFGISSLLVTLFIYLLFPEAKDRKLEDIEDYFKQNNILWINRNRGKNKRIIL